MTHLALVPQSPVGDAAEHRGPRTHGVQTYDLSGTSPLQHAPLTAVKHGFSEHRAHTPRAERSTWSECPNTSHYRLNVDTGQVVKAYCKRLSCPSCIVTRAIGVGQAVALAEPTHMVTITQLGNDWPTIHAGMRKFTARLRRVGVDGHFAYHVEPFENGQDTHAHLWWRGAKPSHEQVGAATRGAGIGWHHAITTAPNPSEHYRVPSQEYGLKMILAGRPDDPTSLWPGAKKYLEVNGGRLVHNTQGFWRDADGTRCTLARAQVAARGHRRGQWIAVPA